MAEPLNLDAVTSTGATYAGSPVKKVIVVFEDDRQARLDLPIGIGPKKSDGGWVRSKSGKAILAALAADGGTMKGATVAKAAGYPYSGSFRQCLRALVAAGEVKHDDNDGYSISDA